MPELPEVENISASLRETIVGRSVDKLIFHIPKLRIPVPADAPALLHKQLIIGVARRSKYIVIDFQHTYSMIIHLGMSGTLSLIGEGHTYQLVKHDHMLMHLSSGLLVLNDARRFGLVAVLPTSSLDASSFFAHLGVEPLTVLSQNKTLYHKLTTSRRSIKTVLLDQTVIAGIGNIYASEILFLAGISPLRLSNSLRKKEIQHLYDAIATVLRKAIKLGGSTLRNYKNIKGETGDFLTQASVYGKANEACNICGSTIQKLSQGGRTTYFCDECQR